MSHFDTLDFSKTLGSSTPQLEGASRSNQHPVRLPITASPSASTVDSPVPPSSEVSGHEA